MVSGISEPLHCAVCNPRNLSFLRRYRDSGFVYIAQSSEANLIKIGITKTLYERIDHLNWVKYAGAKDWTLVGHIYCEEGAGVIETAMHKNLMKYSFISKWYFDGSEFRTPREVFRVNIAIAIKELKKLGKGFGKYHPEIN